MGSLYYKRYFYIIKRYLYTIKRYLYTIKKEGKCETLVLS